MTKAGGNRPRHSDRPQKRLDRTSSQHLPLLSGTGDECAEESDRSHRALPSYRTTTKFPPASVRVVDFAVLEPRQSFLKTGMPAPTQLGKSMQCPCRQPRQGALTLAARKPTLAGS